MAGTVDVKQGRAEQPGPTWPEKAGRAASIVGLGRPGLLTKYPMVKPHVKTFFLLKYWLHFFSNRRNCVPTFEKGSFFVWYSICYVNVFLEVVINATQLCILSKKSWYANFWPLKRYYSLRRFFWSLIVKVRNKTEEILFFCWDFMAVQKSLAF